MQHDDRPALSSSIQHPQTPVTSDVAARIALGRKVDPQMVAVLRTNWVARI